MTIFADAAAAGPARKTARTTERTARIRHYVMTPPRFFAVDYAINPWMDTNTPVDAGVAVKQWENLRDTYRRLGHVVDLVAPVPGLPDMVYAANGGLILNGAALVARFKYPQRQQESIAYADWMTGQGYTPVQTQPCQRRPGRPAARRRNDPGRDRFPHRSAVARRDRRDLRAGRSSACSWSIRVSTTSTPHSRAR